MIKVILIRDSNYFSEFYMNISHIREKNTIIEELQGYRIVKRKVYDQFGGYTVGSYSLPLSHISPPHYHNHNRIVISRCSPKDNYDRHKGILCCIEKIVERLWPEENFTVTPKFNKLGRFISSDKSIVLEVN